MNKEPMRFVLRVTKSLADLQRVRILMLLRNDELCVCQIIAVLNLAPSTVSKHLSILDVAGLVSSRKEGRWMYYSLSKYSDDDFSCRITKWLECALKGDETIVGDFKKLEKIKCETLEGLCQKRKSDL